MLSLLVASIGSAVEEGWNGAFVLLGSGVGAVFLVLGIMTVLIWGVGRWLGEPVAAGSGVAARAGLGVPNVRDVPGATASAVLAASAAKANVAAGETPALGTAAETPALAAAAAAVAIHRLGASAGSAVGAGVGGGGGFRSSSDAVAAAAGVAIHRLGTSDAAAVAAAVALHRSRHEFGRRGPARWAGEIEGAGRWGSQGFAGAVPVVPGPMRRA
jgi:Na+-transporting methylmalonyl-CoA/oxaloacetate decarboxylase gamma subunit